MATPEHNLSVYLNDHLAGSVAAVELLRHLETAHEGTDLATFATALRADIEVDQAELEELMGRLTIPRGAARRAIAWIAEKAAELKLAVDDSANGALRLFEGVEAVSLGI